MNILDQFFPNRKPFAERTEAEIAAYEDFLAAWNNDRDADAVRSEPVLTSLDYHGAYDETMSGGLVGGGTARVTSSTTVTAAGGIVAGGSSIIGGTITVIITPAGVVSGGTARAYSGFSETGSAGAVIGGSAGVYSRFSETGSAGAVVGSTADVSGNSATLHIAGGGISAGGLADVTTNRTNIPSGGVVIDSARYANGLRYRVSITVPAGTVGSLLHNFPLGINYTNDLLTSETVVVTDSADNVLQHEVRSFESGHIVLLTKANLNTSEWNGYLYFGE